MRQEWQISWTRSSSQELQTMQINSSIVSTVTMLCLPRILSLIFMGGSRIGTSKILPILNLFTRLLASLDHRHDLSLTEIILSTDKTDNFGVILNTFLRLDKWIKTGRNLPPNPTGRGSSPNPHHAASAPCTSLERQNHQKIR